MLSVRFDIVMLVIAGMILSMACFAYLLHKARRRCKLAEAKLNKEAEVQRDLLTQLTELQNKLFNDSVTDTLTNLPGRKIFEDRLNLTLNQSVRYQLTSGVMFLDLDGFKIINDALGYDVGDALIKEVAGRLVQCIRQVDTVSRFGGDEFVFIFPQLSKGETAAYIAQRILDAIAQPFQVQNSNLYLTASIGVAIYPTDGTDTKTLLKNADNAMHQAKLRGRNNYQFYREEMHVLSRRELILNSSLRSENVFNDFIIYYQPQVNTETKSIISMDALVRWKHPDFGIIPLEDFIRLAENSGKMAQITEWTMRTVCQHLTAWRKTGFLPPSISVPVSVKQLENSHFINTISHLRQEIEFNPESIVFEISETSLPAKTEQMEKILHMMRHLGARIAINNFGAGNLSFHCLRRLPIDYFKIDKSLIQDLTVNKESEAIVKMVIALAKSLNIRIIADGVESMKQEQMLLELGCNIVQGEIFGSPALPAEFANRLIDGMVERV